MTLSDPVFHSHAILGAFERSFTAPLNDMPPRDDVVLADAVSEHDNMRDEELERSYQAGFDAGIASAQPNGAQCEALTDALRKLEPENPDKLAGLFWGALKNLLIAAVGEVTLDEDVFQLRCQNAAEMVTSQMGAPVLHISPKDLPLLDQAKLEIRIAADSSLLPGSVQLSHQDGEIIAGTSKVLADLDQEVAQC